MEKIKDKLIAIENLGYKVNWDNEKYLYKNWKKRVISDVLTLFFIIIMTSILSLTINLSRLPLNGLFVGVILIILSFVMHHHHHSFGNLIPHTLLFTGIILINIFLDYHFGRISNIIMIITFTSFFFLLKDRIMAFIAPIAVAINLINLSENFGSFFALVAYIISFATMIYLTTKEENIKPSLLKRLESTIGAFIFIIFAIDKKIVYFNNNIPNFLSLAISLTSIIFIINYIKNRLGYDKKTIKLINIFIILFAIIHYQNIGISSAIFLIILTFYRQKSGLFAISIIYFIYFIYSHYNGLPLNNYFVSIILFIIGITILAIEKIIKRFKTEKTP